MKTTTQPSGDARRAGAALDRLTALHPKLIDLGLDRTFALLAKLGNPHENLPPVIHVAGTNGKGSVIAQMRAMAEAAGLRVHTYVSPHLCRFNERIRLAGSLIDDGALADLLEEVERLNGDTPVTFFEVTTAAAMLAYSRHDADLLLLETGLGGALDSTNVLARPLATVITPIARDHEHFLGTEIGGIAGQKAGIMRQNTPCFSARQVPEAAAALRQHADEGGVELRIAGSDFGWQATADGGLELSMAEQTFMLPRPSLYGAHQQDNAALAAAVMLNCLPHIPAASLVAGISQAVWPGRIQRLPAGDLVAQAEGRPIWLDGAHNAHGAAALAAALPELGAAQWHIICGALNTRDPKEFLSPLAATIASITCMAIPDQDASLSATDLCAAAQSLGLAAHPAETLDAAITHAAKNAAKNMSDDGAILICGSLYLAGHVLQANKTPPV